MTREQIYNTNIQLQYIINKIINACRVQNYDVVVRSFTTLTGNLMPVLEAVFSDIAYYNQEIEIVNPNQISNALQDMLLAQENKDYVLLADLLELRLLPFLQSLQEVIRSYDGLATDLNVWTNNLAALEKRDISLWKQIQSYHEAYEKETAAGTWQGRHHLEATNSGAFTMAGQDEKGSYYYHSNVNPETEAAAFADYYYDEESDSYVIWGLGLGYHIKEMFRLDDGIRIQVFENDLDVIYHCLMVVDLSNLIANKRFSLIYDPDFKKIIPALDNITENLIIHSPSLRHIRDTRIREQM